MKILSECCKAPVEIGRRPNEFNSLDIIDVCSDCGQEVEYIYTGCECCGEITEKHDLVATVLGDWCKPCISLNKAELLKLTKGAMSA